MIALHINLEGDGAAQDLIDRGMEAIHVDGTESDPMRLLYLKRRMQSGLPSVMFVIPLPGGKQFVAAELSARLLLTAAAAVKGRAEFEGTPL